MKTCTKCKQEKPLEDFYKNKCASDGYRLDCKVCNGKQSKQYSQDHKEQVRKCKKQYRQNHKKEIRKYEKQYQKDHKEELYNKRKERRRNHPEIMKLATMRRRARKKGAEGHCSKEELKAQIDLYNGRCYIPGCGKPYEVIDHVIPLAKGGTNWPDNLRPICWSCNSSKGTKSLEEFLNYKEKTNNA